MTTEVLDAFAFDKLNVRHHAAIKDAVAHDNRFRIEIRAFKRKYHALIDTGATHYFIRLDIVKEHNIPFTSIPGKKLHQYHWGYHFTLFTYDTILV